MLTSKLTLSSIAFLTALALFHLKWENKQHSSGNRVISFLAPKKFSYNIERTSYQTLLFQPQTVAEVLCRSMATRKYISMRKQNEKIFYNYVEHNIYKILHDRVENQNLFSSDGKIL